MSPEVWSTVDMAGRTGMSRTKVRSSSVPSRKSGSDRSTRVVDRERMIEGPVAPDGLHEGGQRGQRDVEEEGVD